jgi:hypothetical protein
MIKKGYIRDLLLPWYLSKIPDTTANKKGFDTMISNIHVKASNGEDWKQFAKEEIKKAEDALK